VLFVTGTPRLAKRADVLGRLLGVASITPVPQAALPGLLGIGDGPAPIAGQHPGADGADVPQAIETAFATMRQRLGSQDPVPHPLGPIEPDQLGAVRSWRAQETTTAYTHSARGLRADLIAEYERLLPGPASIAAAESAADHLRPWITPTELTRHALPGRTLPPVLRRAATAAARMLLDTAPRQDPATWDLVVVDEYQRLPGLLLWLLRRSAGALLLPQPR
jgi:hypothetical protein